MISWRSYTTSKILPTFVGDMSSSHSWSASGSYRSGRQERGNTYDSFSESASYSEYRDRTLTIEEFNGTKNERRVEGRSTFAGTQTLTAPFATVRQETTRTETFDRRVRITKSLTAYEGGVSVQGFVWTTTQIESTLPNGSTTNIPTVSQILTQSTETIAETVFTQATRTIVVEAEGDVTLETYTHPDGDQLVVANTIWENIPENFAAFQWRQGAICDSPATEIPVTELPFASATRFTLSFSESYTRTLAVRHASDSTIGVTTIPTMKENHSTTTIARTFETYKGWGISQETRTCKDRTGFTVYTENDDEGRPQEYTVFEGVSRGVPTSFERVFDLNVESETVVNTTTTTFETYSGRTTFSVPAGYTTGASENTENPEEQLTRTFFISNVVPEETTTFIISGELLKHSYQSWPGLVDFGVFPWSTFGDGNRRYFNLPNPDTTHIGTTTRPATFGFSYNYTDRKTTSASRADASGQTSLGEAVGGGGNSGGTSNWEAKLSGEFLEKIHAGFILSTQPTFQQLKFSHSPFADFGLANPNLSFETKNTHSTIGAFMSDNAQHRFGDLFDGGPVIFGVGGFGNLGLISQGVIGAIPLDPTFSGLVTKDEDGWQLCDSSEYTTVAGSRVGQNFSTTIAWKTLEGTSTKNSTSSGTFTIQSTTVASVGVASEYLGFFQNRERAFAGGFETPNAAQTFFASPGMGLLTTADANGTGTLSTNYSTGTIQKTAPEGPQVISVLRAIPKARGVAALYTQALLDDGLP